MDEASRIAHNMCMMPGYHGTTTTEVVDEFCDRFGNWVFCNGYIRDVIFTPITKNTVAFRTEPRR